MTKERIERLNQLARAAKERPLTEAEKGERAQLRNEYLADIRLNLETQLAHTSVQYPDGTVKKLVRQDKPDKSRS